MSFAATLAFVLFSASAFAAEPPNPMATLAPLATSAPHVPIATPSPSATLPPNVAHPDQVTIGSGKLDGCSNVVFTAGNVVSLDCARGAVNTSLVKTLRAPQLVMTNPGNAVNMAILYRNGKDKTTRTITLLNLGLYNETVVSGSNPPDVRLKLYYTYSR